jgi:hypothetical protein
MPGAGLTVRSVGQARPDRLALKPYWGNPDVRNFREADGNVGFIRSPVRAIALPDPTAPAWLQRAGLGADVIGTGATQRGSEGGGCLMLTTLNTGGVR